MALAAVGTILVSAKDLVGSLLSGLGTLIGIAPRGDLQKFQRTVYPYMRALANRDKLQVQSYWFGELVGVNPDGSYQVLTSKEQGLAGAIAYQENLKNSGTSFYKTHCPRSDGDCVNHPEDLTFEKVQGSRIGGIIDDILGRDEEPYGDGTRRVPVSQSGILSGNSLALMAGAGLIAYLIWGKK